MPEAGLLKLGVGEDNPDECGGESGPDNKIAISGPALDAAVADVNRGLGLWFARLSPEEQAEVETRLGGGAARRYVDGE